MLPLLSADIRVLYCLDYTDSECTLGRSDVSRDILGTLVPLASASSVLRLEGFSTQ